MTTPKKKLALATKTATEAKYLSIKEVAKITCMSEMFWRKVVAEKKIGFFRFGYRIMISRSELDKWIEDRKTRGPRR